MGQLEDARRGDDYCLSWWKYHGDIKRCLGLGEYFSFQIGNGEGYRIEIEIEEDKIHGISYERLFAGLHT